VDVGLENPVIKQLRAAAVAAKAAFIQACRPSQATVRPRVWKRCTQSRNDRIHTHWNVVTPKNIFVLVYIAPVAEVFATDRLCLLRCYDLRYHLNGQSNRHVRITLRTDGQWLWDYVIKFARWQHPPVGCGAWFAVSGTNSLQINSVLHSCNVGYIAT